ncbi:hypothetical protein EDD11_009995 [Mortierella claussenii]|nr:hypothetical protein EDD11_009995 [Mortierella claussenii]
MSSSMDPPTIHTNFSSYPTASPSSRLYQSSPSPSSPSPAMNFQSRSYSMPSLSSRGSSSSLHSQYSSASDRSLSCSPGPSTPSDVLSRSPSFSHERLQKSSMTSSLKHHLPTPFSSALPQPKGYSSHTSHLQHHHLPYPLPPAHHYTQPYPPRQQQHQQHHAQAMPSPRDVYPLSPSASRDHAYDHREAYYHRGDRSPYGGSSDYFSRPTTTTSYHHLPTPTTPTAMERIHPLSPAPLTSPQVATRSIQSSPYSPRSATGRPMMTMDDEYSPSRSHSPSVSSDRSVFSPEPTSPSYPSEHPYMTSSPASTSMSSLSSYQASPGPSSSNTQLLLCPVCSRAFKPSKNQNCNLRRHLKNVHNMSPTMHPRKCKWDSLPDGRVKDDKDRKERTRKSKRLWARKFRLRRKVEEAAVVLSMLSQAM